MAVRGLKADVLALLLDAGADLHSKQPTFTPLAFACFEGTAEQVELLLERGARTDVAIDYLGYRGTTPLMFAAQGGNVSMVRALLGAGADKNVKDASGRTASDYAKGKSAERIRALLF
jgi:ankyrin repeat protein